MSLAGKADSGAELQNTALEDVTLASSAGKTRIIATVPSLDSPVCHQENKKSNEEIGATHLSVLRKSQPWADVALS